MMREMIQMLGMLTESTQEWLNFARRMEGLVPISFTNAVQKQVIVARATLDQAKALFDRERETHVV